MKMVKFSEALWRFIFYFSFCILGYFALFTPETAIWIRDTKDHWRNWPHHPISETIKFYYLIELGSYIHQLMWTEVTRSDAVEMILHHLITILLISMSWLTNYTRIGASILLVHDLADIFLECGKLFNYASKVKEFKAVCSVITDTFFAVFAITFFVTRLVIYPRFLLYSMWVECPTIWGGIFHGFWYIALLLSALQVLHIFWFYLICKMIIQLFAGGIKKDERSDDEEEDDNNGGGSSKKKKK